MEFIYSICFIFCCFMSSFRTLAEIPLGIKWISVSLFLCILGLGTWDTFYSIYIESIVTFWLWVSIFWALYSFTKLLTVIPIWILNDQGKTDDLLSLGKLSWMISGLLYYLAWNYNSWILLLLWTLFSWLAWAIIYPWYWTLYKKSGNKRNHWLIFWLYYASINLAYCAWALISAYAILYLDLHEIFLFMVFFILLSLIRDGRIWFFSKKLSPKDKPIILSFKSNWLLPLLWKYIVSRKPWKEIYHVLRDYQWSMYSALWAQALISLMEYVGFLFIPIIAVDNNLSLSEVALISAIMRLPSILNVFVWSLGDKYNKKLLIGILLLIWWFLYIMLWNSHSFLAMMGTTFGIFFVIAFVFPLVSALISDWIKNKEEGTIAWVKEFIWTSWEILGSLWFWVLITAIGIHTAFVLFWYMLIMLSIYIIVKKVYEIIKHK